MSTMEDVDQIREEMATRNELFLAAREKAEAAAEALRLAQEADHEAREGLEEAKRSLRELVDRLAVVSSGLLSS